MKILRLIAEVELTEKEAKKILIKKALVWDVNTPIAEIMNKKLYFKKAVIIDCEARQ